MIFLGGVFFFDSADNSLKSHDSNTLPGRIVLVRGGFGSGKTSFGLTTAAAIAECGGLAVYFALEFDRQQTLFNLERLGYPTKGGRFKTFCSLKPCMKHFRKRLQDSYDAEGQLGAILILEVQHKSTAINVEKLFGLINGIAESDWPVFPRIVVVDSLNAVRREFFSDEFPTDVDPKAENSSTETKGPNEAESRTRRSARKNDPEFRRLVLKELRSSTSLGTNVVLLSEEDDLTWVGFGEDISDTVVRLYGPTEDRSAVDPQFPGMSHRSISISKSRYQKEHSGFHSFEIKPGTGFRIRMSTESRASIFRSRGEYHLPPKKFGVAAIDKLLLDDRENFINERANCGRVVCMEGALGTFKTQFGICFLQSSYL
jgi:KaiC/GvpD/RAD55 family RecA-like ATPase